jgi:cobalt-zinc-cadmium efflux system membrane fusion protein
MHYFNKLSSTQKKITVIFFLILLILLLVWLVFKPKVHVATVGSTTVIAVPEIIAPATIRYAPGAAQLSMILSKPIPLTPVPIAEQLSARIAYDEEITARIGVSFSGRIIALKAAPGDIVKAGQALAVIDSPDFGTAFADLNKARADEKRKQLAVKRAKDLVPGEAISTRDWEAVQADYAQAQAETARAEQRLKNINPHDLNIKGQLVTLASPMNGVVTERNASPALEVSPNMTSPLFVVTDPKSLWLMIDLPETLLGLVKLGSDVALMSDAYPEDRFSAKIIQLGQVINPNTRRANVLARIDNSAGKLLPEMFVRASILQNSGQGVRVPNEGIMIRGLFSYVFVETNPGEFTLRPVKLLKRGIDFSYVGEGLQGDEKIVTKGALLLDAEMLSRASDK